MNPTKTTTSGYCTGTFGLVAVVVTLLLSAPAHALSLGNFSVQSALDQPLEAQIRLRSVDPETLKSLKVSLGSVQDFRRADLPRPKFLTQFQFKVAEEDGKPVVLVTTLQPVKEPFVHFLVAVQWHGGKLVREYTGLIDPPMYAASLPAAVETPVVEAPVIEAPQVATDMGTSQEIEPAGGESLLGRSPISGSNGRAAEYGPTRAGDTLWGIASKLDTGSAHANIYQIMIALLRQNPGAFVDHNINRLKQGQILRLDDIASVAEISAEEAQVAYAAQLVAWQAHRVQVASTGEAGPAQVASAAQPIDAASGSETATADTERAGAAIDSAIASDSAGGAGDEVLRIVQASLDKVGDVPAGSGLDNSGEVSALQGKIATLEDALASKNLAVQELQQRVRLLESQIENAQRLIAIENQGLAAAQQQATEQVDNTQASATVAGEEPTQIAAQSIDPVAPATQPSEIESTELSAANTASASAANANTGAVRQVGQVTQAGQSSQSPVGQSSSTERDKQPAKAVKVASHPVGSVLHWRFLDTLFSSWTWMLVAAFAVLLLLLGLLIYLRRRRSIAEFEESILAGSGLDSYSETTDGAATSASDTSFLSDFGAAGMGNMQTDDEVDPLAEAEVYLAYGRDEQAEEVLKEAARRNPGRVEVKLKLLEIYKQRNDVKSFETIAEELYPAGDSGDLVTWNKVVAMGQELNPDNPLFQEAEIEAPTSADLDFTTDTLSGDLDANGATDDIGFNVDDFAAEPQMESDPLELDSDWTSGGATGTGEDTLDFGDEIIGQASQTRDPETQPFPTPDEQTDLDRELDRLAGEREPSPATETLTAADDDGIRSLFDDDRDDDQEGPANTGKAFAFDAEDSQNDFELNLDEDNHQEYAGNGADRPESEVLGFGHTDANGDFGSGAHDDLLEFEADNIPPEDTWADASSDVAPTAKVQEAPDPDATAPYNEAQTKLNLARAYLDMGDKAGARSIIDEVMREGDPAQRDQASELAAQL